MHHTLVPSSTKGEDYSPHLSNMPIVLVDKPGRKKVRKDDMAAFLVGSGTKPGDPAPHIEIDCMSLCGLICCCGFDGGYGMLCCRFFFFPCPSVFQNSVPVDAKLMREEEYNGGFISLASSTSHKHHKSTSNLDLAYSSPTLTIVYTSAS